MRYYLHFVILAVLFTVGISASESATSEGQRLQLTNTSDVTAGWVRVSDDDSLEPQTFTIEAWITPRGNGFGNTGDGKGALIVTKPREGESGNFLQSFGLAWLPNVEKVRALVAHDIGSTGKTLNSNGTAQLGHTNHIAMSFDGSWLRIYINGRLDSETQTSSSVVDYGTEDILIGAGNFAGSFKRRFEGQIDDVRFWDHARTWDEIGGMKNCRLVGDETGLLAYYTFDAGDATDDSGNGHDGLGEGDVTYPSAEARCPDLEDGFEFGDTSAWSRSVQ